MARRIVIAVIVLLVLGAGTAALLASRENVREPAVAGTFYPADPDVLDRTVQGFLARAEPQAVDGRLIALVAPHAGYQFSGLVAAHAYRHIADRPVDTVILIGASHFAAYAGAAVYAEGAWRTPLGDVRINGKIARSLVNEAAGVTVAVEPFAKEHSLEVQLPFLQRTVKDLTIVPILIGAPTRESFAHLTDRLTAVLRKQERAIIIASTDLSHYHDHTAAVVKDRRVIDAVQRMSAGDLQALLAAGHGEACGGHPLLLTMMVARNLGATNGVLYDHRTSGDVTGEKQRVVGYAAMGLYRSRLTAGQNRELLAIARRTIHEQVRHGQAPEQEAKDLRLRADGAAFVTINRQHRLRGCIGDLRPDQPLYRSVMKNAAAAACRDPRFPPMTPAELADMEVEITILSPLEPLDDVQDIRIGTHGLYLMKDGRSSVFLPQVPVEQGWVLATYLEQLAFKAGLQAEAWKEARLYFFTADVVK